jgi:hypothetical protein
MASPSLPAGGASIHLPDDRAIECTGSSTVEPVGENEPADEVGPMQ